MKPCWKEKGLTEKGASYADAALNTMLKAVETAFNNQVAKDVFDEACFRLFILPQRTKAYQRKYMKDNSK